MKYTIRIPCLFGLEGLVADELRYMRMSEVTTETGRVSFRGTVSDIAKANIRIRCGERVLVLLGEYEAKSFDDLFEGVKAISWEDYIPKNAVFPVKGYSLNSQLHSVPGCQSIIKKAAATRLANYYKVERMPESGSEYQIRFSIIKDTVSIYLDSTGTALHKRGYRPNSNPAPLRETLAAAIVKLSRYKGKEVFIDPFCGSGTIAIEAALAAKNRAPGIGRRFAGEKWEFIANDIWRETREEAISQEYSGEYDIRAGDIDPAAIEISKANAERAKVSEQIHFEVKDALKQELPLTGGIVAANPPYGERLMDVKMAESLCREMGKAYRKREGISLYILSPNLDFEKLFGAPARKRRKLYNGMIACQLYIY